MRIRILLAVAALGVAGATAASAASEPACVYLTKPGAPRKIICTDDITELLSSPSPTQGCKVNVGACDPGGDCTVNVGYCTDSGSCRVNVGYCTGNDLIRVF